MGNGISGSTWHITQRSSSVKKVTCIKKMAPVGYRNFLLIVWNTFLLFFFCQCCLRPTGGMCNHKLLVFVTEGQGIYNIFWYLHMIYGISINLSPPANNLSAIVVFPCLCILIFYINAICNTLCHLFTI